MRPANERSGRADGRSPLGDNASRYRARGTHALRAAAVKVLSKLRSLIEPAPPLPDGVVTLGRGSYFTPRVVYHEGDTARIRVGKYCSIAGDAEFIPGGNHHLDWVSTYPFRIQFDMPGRARDGQPWSKGDIVVGNDVWIGRGACILSGVTIGNGAVVAAHSVVSKDVPAYAVVAGSPASIVKHRFEPEIAEALERIAWWNWPEEVIRERVTFLSSERVQDFLERFGPTEEQQ